MNTQKKTANPNFGKGKSSWNKGKKLSQKHKDNIKKAMKNVELWNKGKKHSPETIQKMKDGMKGKNKGKFKNEKNPVWRGDIAGTAAMHQWVIRRKGKASEHTCEFCGKRKAYHWANKKHDYRRVLGDYMALCVKCHKLYDNVRQGLTQNCTIKEALRIKFIEAGKPTTVSVFSIDVKDLVKDLSKQKR